MSKGESTKTQILKAAYKMARTQGLEGISIGGLASEVGMSKSGLFAHFKSKENLQCEVIQHAGEKYIESVMGPAIAAPRGIPRIREFTERTLQWDGATKGGCVFIAAATEFDDKPGAVKDLLKQMQWQFIDSLKRMAKSAVKAGDFAEDCDTDQFAFDCYSMILGFHHFHRLLDDEAAMKKLSASVEGLIDQYSTREMVQ